MDPKVDAFIDRAVAWKDEMTALRTILNRCDLDEGIKWGKPCYSNNGANIVIMQPMKKHLSLMFFKGVLIKDPKGVLVDQGANTRAAKRIEFTDVDQVIALEDALSGYIADAIDVEERGLTVERDPQPHFVAELAARMERDDVFRDAFRSLTPGRQREYNLYFSDAKKPSTREGRITRYAPKILRGKGLRDR